MSKLKTKEQLLKALKKANKVRRFYLANRAGFDDVESYRKHLEDGIKNDDSENQKPTIHNVHILDTSGSMGGQYFKGSKLFNAVLGIKKEHEELAKDDSVNYTNSLVNFSYSHSQVTEFWKVPFSEVPPSIISRSNGCTALFKALVTTLERLIEENTEEDRVLVKVFTDGGENDSPHRYSAHKVREVMKKCEDLGITVTFVGTERDVEVSQRILKFDSSNTLVHDNTPKAVMDSFMFSTNSTKTYATAVKRGASKQETLTGFYKQAETL